MIKHKPFVTNAVKVGSSVYVRVPAYIAKYEGIEPGQAFEVQLAPAPRKRIEVRSKGQNAVHAIPPRDSHSYGIRGDYTPVTGIIRDELGSVEVVITDKERFLFDDGL